MAAVIGSLRANLSMNSVAFERGIDAASRRMKSMQRNFTRIGNQMKSIGTSMTVGLSAPIIAFGGFAINAAGKFEAAMNRVAAISGASQAELNKLTVAAREMGAKTQFSATEAADALTFLAMAGFDAHQAIDALPATLQLAASAKMDLADAADIVSNVMSGYGFKVEDLARVNDVLVKTFTSANTDLRQLGEAMKHAGPIASAAGVAFEESAAAIGLMGNAGIQASMAGTSLRGAIGRILEPTGAAKNAMNQLGLSFTDSQGRLKSFDEIIRQLEPHADNAGLFIELFGQRAGPAMAALVSQGADALVDLRTKLENSGGTAQRIADAMMLGFEGSKKRLASAFETMQLSIANSGVLELFTAFSDKLAIVFTKISELNPVILKWGTIIGGVVAIVGPAILAVGVLATAFAAVAPALVLISGPAAVIGAIVIGVGAAIVWVARLIDKLGGFNSAMIIAGSYAKEIFQRIGDVFHAARDRAEGAFFGIKASVLEVLAEIVGGLPEFSNKVIGAYVGAYSAVVAAWSALPAAFQRLAAQAVNALIDKMQGGLAAVISGVNKILSAVNLEEIPAPNLNKFKASVGEAVDITGKMGAAFKSAAETDYVGKMKTSLESVAENARDIQAAAYDSAASYMAMAKAPLKTTQALEEAQRMLSKSTETTSRTMSEAEETAKKLNKELDESKDLGKDLGDNLEDGASRGARALNALKDVADTTKQHLDSAFSGFLKTLSTGNVQSAFSGLLNDFKSASSSSFSDLVLGSFKVGGGGFSGLVKGITGGFSAIKTGLTGASSALGSFVSGTGSFGSVLSGIGGAASAIMPAIGAVMAVSNLISGFSSTTLTGSGLDLGIKNGSVTGGTYKQYESSSWWGLFSDSYERNQGFTSSARNSMQAQVDGIEKAVKGVFQGLGGVISDTTLNSVNLAVTRIKTSGLSQDEVEKKVAAIFERYKQALSSAIGGVTLESAALLLQVQSFLNPLGKAFDLIGGGVTGLSRGLIRSAASASAAMVELAGGVDALGKKTGAFFEAFFTDQEKLDYLQRIISDTFERLKLSIPKTEEEFKKLVLSQNLLTQSGRETYNALLDIAPQFDKITDASDAAAAAAEETAKRFEDAVKAMRGTYSLDAGKYATEAQAKLAFEMANADKYSQDVIAAQNVELRAQTTLLNTLVGLMRRQNNVAGDANILVGLT